MVAVTAFPLSERPEMVDGFHELAEYWPQFMREDPVGNRHWHTLLEQFAPFQLGFVDESGAVVARALCAPITWDGTDDGLPDGGWDWALVNAVEAWEAGAIATAVSALEINIHPALRGRGLSRVALQAMKTRVLELGFDQLVAPVRPNRKAAYPLTPMERYTTWTHDASGGPFDPWLRVHWRDGARIARTAAESMRIPGTVAEWESWAGMRFPDSGDYIVPEALAPVHIDRDADEGLYIEPNVWMVHNLKG
jgi:GNAT superfamily N-acetyltransferase